MPCRCERQWQQTRPGNHGFNLSEDRPYTRSNHRRDHVHWRLDLLRQHLRFSFRIWFGLASLGNSRRAGGRCCLPSLGLGSMCCLLPHRAPVSPRSLSVFIPRRSGTYIDLVRSGAGIGSSQSSSAAPALQTFSNAPTSFMNRPGTIAATWLIPPLLFWLEVAASGWTASSDSRVFIYGGGLGATLVAVLGAIFAVLAEKIERPRANSTTFGTSRRSIAIGLLAFLPITSYLVASEGNRSLPTLSAFLAVWISALVFLMPLFGALIFWRPHARVVSRSFAGVVVACALPFVAIAALDFALRTSFDAYQPPHDNWSPLICSRANVDEPAPMCGNR